MKARTIAALVLAVMLALFVAPTTGAEAPDTAGVSPKLLEEAQRKAGLQEILRAKSSAPTARLGEAIDPGQVSVGALLERGILELTPDTRAAYAYIQPYREPNDWAHRNYCGPGAAVVLLSHWDPELPKTVDIDQLGREMDLNPNMGVWIYKIASPVNRWLNEHLGEQLDWYRYGKAASLADLRYMLNVDIMQNGVPLITGVMTRGLPGWGSRNVGHIIAAYGYTRAPDGTEYVAYVDTAPPASGFNGWILHNIEISWFWRAVSGNSAQVW